MRLARSVVTPASSLPLSALAGAVCASPPVVSQAQALCVAREFVTARTHPLWETTFEFEEANLLWKVTFRPSSSDVAGGSGELAIDKRSGKVSVVHLYR